MLDVNKMRLVGLFSIIKSAKYKVTLLI